MPRRQGLPWPDKLRLAVTTAYLALRWEGLSREGAIARVARDQGLLPEHVRGFVAREFLDDPSKHEELLARRARRAKQRQSAAHFTGLLRERQARRRARKEAKREKQSVITPCPCGPGFSEHGRLSPSR